MAATSHPRVHFKHESLPSALHIGSLAVPQACGPLITAHVPPFSLKERTRGGRARVTTNYPCECTDLLRAGDSKEVGWKKEGGKSPWGGRAQRGPGITIH